MKSLQSLASRPLNFKEPPQDQGSVEISDEVAAKFDELFIELQTIFPAWKHAGLTIEQLKRSWLKAFKVNGITTFAQIKIGLDKARKSTNPFVPSVGQFCEWCKPCLEDYGLLPAEQALRIWVNRQSKSHPAIYAAAQATGSWALKSMNHQDLLKLFTRNYEISCARVMAGEDLSIEIPLALPAKVVVITEQSQAMQNAKKLRALLKSKRVNHA